MAKNINLLEDNILSAITKLAIPLMGMSFLQMAYNLTDMFWIAKLGSSAVASVGTGGLLLWLSMGIHMLAQVGGQVYVAQNLGAGDKDQAGKYAHSAIFVCFVICATLGFCFTALNTPIISIFNLNTEQVILDAKKYVFVTGGFVFFSLMAKLLIALITTTGNSKTPFLATAAGLIFNMILDPLLIYGYLGLPALGVLGAAIATVLAQFIVFLVLLIYVSKDKILFCYVNLKQKPDLAICKSILKLSFPAAVQGTIYPLISIFISRLVADFGDSAVGIQRIGSQVESISWMTAEGFAIAVNSFMAQNYGAKNYKRTKQGFFTSFYMLTSVGIFASLLLMLFPEALFSIFLTDPLEIKMGASYLFIMGVSQAFMCWEILGSNACNALGKSLPPAVISIIFTSMRIPLSLILIPTLAIDGVWWSITLSTVCKGALLLSIIIFFVKRLVKE